MPGACAAIIDAVRRQKAAERQMRAMTVGLKGRMKARRKASAKALSELHSFPVREDFACLLLCAECKLLTEEGNRCEQCGSTELFDLTEHAIMDRLQDDEDEERQRIPSQVRPLSRLATLLVAVAGSVVLGAASSIEYEHLWVSTNGWVWMAGALIVGVTTAWCYIYVQRPLAWWWFKARPRGPARWRHPAPRYPDKPLAAEEVAGRADGQDLLSAPLSGRQCLAWRVSVLFDRQGDARPPEWVLDESRVADLSVDGRSVEGARTTFWGEPQLLPAEQLSLDAAALATFLRIRGISLHEGELELFESVVTPREEVAVDFPTDDTRFGPLLVPISERGGVATP